MLNSSPGRSIDTGTRAILTDTNPKSSVASGPLRGQRDESPRVRRISRIAGARRGGDAINTRSILSQSNHENPTLTDATILWSAFDEKCTTPDAGVLRVFSITYATTLWMALPDY